MPPKRRGRKAVPNPVVHDKDDALDDSFEQDIEQFEKRNKVEETGRILDRIEPDMLQPDLLDDPLTSETKAEQADASDNAVNDIKGGTTVYNGDLEISGIVEIRPAAGKSTYPPTIDLTNVNSSPVIVISDSPAIQSASSISKYHNSASSDASPVVEIIREVPRIENQPIQELPTRLAKLFEPPVLNIDDETRLLAEYGSNARQTHILDAVTRKTNSVSTQTIESSVEEFLVTCILCLSNLTSDSYAVSTSCGHLYCQQCLIDLLKKSNKCPKCSHLLKGKTPYHRIYF